MVEKDDKAAKQMKVLKSTLDPVFDMLSKAINMLDKEHGPLAAESAYCSFLATAVHNQSMSVLKCQTEPGTTKEQHAKVVMREFALHKKNTANSIALGFSTAMSDFSGREIEYVCQIMPEPPTANKLPC